MPKIVEKLLRAGEGRIVKRLSGLADQVNALEDDFVRLSDAEPARGDRPLQGPHRRWRVARRPAARGLRDGP
nr:hypothetical protein [Angustibacter aerolatus]